MLSLPSTVITPLLHANLKTFSTICEVTLVLHAVLSALFLGPLSDEQKAVDDGLFLSLLVAFGLRAALHVWDSRKEDLSE